MDENQNLERPSVSRHRRLNLTSFVCNYCEKVIWESDGDLEEETWNQLWDELASKYYSDDSNAWQCFECQSLDKSELSNAIDEMLSSYPTVISNIDDYLSDDEDDDSEDLDWDDDDWEDD